MLLELMEKWQEAKAAEAEARFEIETKTGRSPEEIMEGMRALLAPKEEEV